MTEVDDVDGAVLGNHDIRWALELFQHIASVAHYPEQLSDENNIKVARRTVAKYREALNLLPSNKRKQLF